MLVVIAEQERRGEIDNTMPEANNNIIYFRYLIYWSFFIENNLLKFSFLFSILNKYNNLSLFFITRNSFLHVDLHMLEQSR